MADHLGFKDEEFTKEGCDVDSKENILKESDILLQMNLPTEENLNIMKEKIFSLEILILIVTKRK